MYNYSYPARKSNCFLYADGYCSVFPRGIEKQFKSGKGHIVLEDEYIVVINDDTPEDIERKFLIMPKLEKTTFILMINQKPLRLFSE
jgi:hypothetical protein